MSRIARLAAVALVAAAASPSEAQEAATLRWPLRFESVGAAARPEALLHGREDDQRLAIHIAGDLVATTAAAWADSAIVAYRVDHATVSFTLDDEPAPESERRIREAMGGLFFARHGADGRIAALRYDPAIGAFERGVIASLLASLQFAVPPSGPPESWEAEEDEPNGRFLAGYTVIGGAGEAGGPPLVIAKRKIRFLPEGPADAPFDVLPEIVVEGTVRATGVYDPARRRLVTLEARETQAIAMGRRPLGRTETVVSLGPVTSEAPSDGATVRAALARATAPAAMVSTRLDTAARGAIARRAIGDRTVGEALAELAAADTAGARGAVDPELFAVLRWLAVADSAAADTMAATLAAAAAGGLTMPALGAALAAAGTERAHAGLAIALRKRIDDPAAASHLLVLLGSASEPTDEAERALREIAIGDADDELGHAARLALGSLARRAARRTPERAARIVADLIASHGPRPAGETARRLLLVLGNAGAPAALERARPALADPSPAVRGAAVGALRFVRDSLAEALILEVLAGDPSPSVRLAALDALSFRPTTERSFAARGRAARNDPEASVRLAAVQSLWSDRNRFPAARQLLERSVEDDPAPEVRRRVRWLLDGS